jgi:outer membrane protein assembly factor BamA
MRTPTPRLRRSRAIIAHVLWVLAALATPATAQTPDPIARMVGRTVSAVRLDIEGTPTRAPELIALIDVRVGQPLDLSALRVSLMQLFSAGRFENVSVRGVDNGSGVVLVFDLVPVHPIEGVEFRGQTGLSRPMLERELRQRFGGWPASTQIDAAARAVERVLEEEGFRSAKATSAIETTHAPERAMLVLTIDAGPLAVVRSASVDGQSPLSEKDILSRVGVRVGEAYRPREIDTGLDGIIETLRTRGYYEATVSHARDVVSDDGRSVDVHIAVDAGGLVTLKFTGDAVPGNLNDLVPVRREGSADSDLLEDSVRRIESALRREGYWKAQAAFTRTDSPSGTLITINVIRGERYRFDRLDVSGNTAMATDAIETMIDVQPDSVFDGSKIARGIAAIRAAYLLKGYAAASVVAAASELPPTKPGGEPRVVERITIDEGPLTLVGEVAVIGATALTRAEITAVMRLQSGGPFVAGFVPADRDAIKDQYDQRGYSSAVVDVRPQISDDRQTASVTVEVVAEGPRTVLDRVIIVGNRRVSQATILAAVAPLKQGQAIGTADRIDLQQRLASLGLFRRINIAEAPHADGELGTDLVITVEESPATTIAPGAGIEAGFRQRSAAGGGTVSKLEVSPRASLEFGRSNLWGKNRSLSLFSGVSLRPIDDPGNPTRDGKCCGFSEYRVITSFREPRLFGWNADGLVSVSAEQAIRSSFNFSRRAGSLQMLRRFTRLTTYVASYSLQRVELSNQRIEENDQLLVDRLFPQIRLSVLSSSLLHDTRNDAIAPGGGVLLSADADVAARAIGSQVGFAKVYFQAFTYHRLPNTPRVVLAGAARLGLVRGFVRTVGGQRVEDVPASQRFFSGGGTTVRGFQLDRLGTPAILNADGLSNGGNGLLLFNAEVRTSLSASIGVVGFVDAGNVFARVHDISLADLRPTIGTGLRFRSPIGPLRLDVGWKLGGLRVTDNRRWEFHFSIGEAF